MEAMDELSSRLAKIFAGKEQRRLRLARLPYPEKVRVVMELQQMVAPILRGRGRAVRPWNEQGRLHVG